MAVLETTVKRFIGTSTDSKPHPGAFTADGHEMRALDLPAGSTFFEEDTGRIYRWTGTEWVFAESPELRELQAIRGLLATIAETMNRNTF